MNANLRKYILTGLTILATFMLASPAQAQSNATDSTFFPMHQGNKWVFEHWDSAWPSEQYHTMTEIKHPVIELDGVYSTLLNSNNPGYMAGKTLVCNETACKDSVWVDFHVASQQLFMRYVDRKILIADFSLNVGDSLIITDDLDNPDWMMSKKITDRSQRVFNGELVDIIQIETTYPYLDAYGYMASKSVNWYQKGLGRYDLGLCGECSSSVAPTLIAARINGEVLFGDITVSNEDDRADTPDNFRLDAAYPNPFNPTTTLRFALVQSSEVSLAVYDVLGRQVLAQNLGALHAGVHHHALAMSGHPSGTYLVRMQSGGQVRSTRITLVK